MPSIFNHENACWGVKRSICNVFQYDIGDELQTRKSNEYSIVPNSNSETPILNSVQYSVSSNGYYGYQPHSIIQNQTTADNAMDIEENCNVSLNVPYENHIPNLHEGYKSMSIANYHQNISRKRPMSDSTVDRTKRSRYDEAVDAEPVSKTPGEDLDQGAHQRGGGYAKHRRWSGSAGSCDTTTEQLLRQTHGCEVYLYERSCDY